MTCSTCLHFQARIVGTIQNPLSWGRCKLNDINVYGSYDCLSNPNLSAEENQGGWKSDMPFREDLK